MQRRKSVSNAIEHTIAEITEQIRHKQNDKRNSILIHLNDSTYQTISYILSKVFRSKDELLIIKIYLSTIPRFLSLFKSKHTDQILISLAILLKSEKKPKNSMIMRYGEKGNLFYIVLKGNAVVLLPKENNIKLTALNYLKILITLKVFGEEEMFNRTLLANKLSFLIDNNSINEIMEQLEKKQTKKILENPTFQALILSQEEIKELILWYTIVYQKTNEMNSNNLQISPEEYMKIIYPSFVHDEINQNLGEDVIIYSYIPITVKHQGDIFGELALQNPNSKRTATIICMEECIFGILSRESYNNIIKDIQWKKRKKNVNFILSFQIFKGMNWNYFESKVFNFFKNESYEQGQVMTKQNDKSNKVYFIQEGVFELTSCLSIEEMQKIIKSKSNYLSNKKIFSEDKEKKCYKISIINNKDVIGLNDVCYDNYYFINATCISTHGVVYSLDIEILDKISQKIQNFKGYLETFINQREIIMAERLYNIYLYNKKKQKEKIQKEEENSEILKMFSERTSLKKKMNEINNSNTKNNLQTLNNQTKPYLSLLNFQRPKKKNNSILFTGSVPKRRPPSKNQASSNQALNTSSTSIYDYTYTTEYVPKAYFHTTPNKPMSSRKRFPNAQRTSNSFSNSNQMLKEILGTRYSTIGVQSKTDQISQRLIDNNQTHVRKGISFVDFLYYDQGITRTEGNAENSKTRNIHNSLGSQCSTYNKSNRTVKNNEQRAKSLFHKKIIINCGNIPQNFFYNAKPFRIVKKKKNIQTLFK